LSAPRSSRVAGRTTTSTGGNARLTDSVSTRASLWRAPALGANRIATITNVDRIVLEGMVFSGKHGVTDAERARSQRFTVDIEVEADLARAARSDQIEDTIDYRRVRAIAKEVIEGEPAHLIETLAGRIARKALQMPRVAAVSVKVTKRPPSMRPIDGAAVLLRRARR